MCDITKSSRKLNTLVSLKSDAFIAEVKRIRGRKQPLTAAAVQGLRGEYARTIEPAKTLMADACVNERVKPLLKPLLTQFVRQQETDMIWLEFL